MCSHFGMSNDYVCSTPLSGSNKRELSSPLDYTDFKKSKLYESPSAMAIEFSTEDILAISAAGKDYIVAGLKN